MHVVESGRLTPRLAIVNRYYLTFGALLASRPKFHGAVSCRRNGLQQIDPCLVPGPIHIVFCASQRAVNAGGADFEPVGVLNRVTPLDLPARRISPRFAATDAAQSSIFSCPVSGRSAMICKVGSSAPAIQTARAPVQNPKRSASGSISCSQLAVISVKNLFQSICKKAKTFPRRPRFGASPFKISQCRDSLLLRD